MLKALLSHVLLNYDIKFPDGADGKKVAATDGTIWFASDRTASKKVQVLFRRRGDKVQ